MAVQIQNPILPGFNADPCALRVGSDYYIVTSTFNWFPGVSLYHSRDLKNWRLAENILDRSSQLDLRGNPESCGVWAPQLSYNAGTQLFYLAYTDVKSLSPSFFDLNNYVVTAPSIEGPWSDPVYLNSSGFDPSLFHDDDGRSWLLNLAWEFGRGYAHPGPIIYQEFDPESCRLPGDFRELYRGNPKFGCTEGPHLYKRNGWYYLITAEGGTGYGHAVQVSRSRQLHGPYSPSPHGPLLTSRSNPFPEEDDPDPDFLKPRFYNPELTLQKAGHGSLADTPDGRTLLFHLCARPVMPAMRCVLNRETAVQEVVWKEDWPVLMHTPPWPQEYLILSERNTNRNEPAPASSVRDVTQQGVQRFSAEAGWPVEWYSLKSPRDRSWCVQLPETEGGGVRLRGRNSPYSAHDCSLIARRLQHFNCSIETTLELDDPGYRQMAGLIVLTGSRTYYYLRKYYSRTLGTSCLGIHVSRNGQPDELSEFRTPVPGSGPITLRCEIRQPALKFFWSAEPSHTGNDRRNSLERFHRIGPDLDATVLSDEFTNNGPGAFDGTFTGVTVQDLDRHSTWACFSCFAYYQL